MALRELRNAGAVTPSDTLNLNSASGDDLNAGILYIGVSGDVKIDPVNQGDAGGVVFKNLPTGQFLNVIAARVYSTDTTALSIVVCW